MTENRESVDKWQELTVTEDNLGEKLRLDVWIAKFVERISRSKAQHLIENGHVKVNGEKAASSKYIVRLNDRISFFLEEKKADNGIFPVPMDLDIVYEDDSLLVVNKPAGISVHPGAGEKDATLVHGLLAHCKNLGRSTSHDEEDEDTTSRPGIVHRLDKDTSGLLVVAKTDFAHAHLAKQFHDKVNFRQYVALLAGKLPEGEWTRESWLHRDPKERTRFASIEMAEYHRKRDAKGTDLPGYRYAKSLFKSEKSEFGLSLVSVRLFTGRTHQIRVHARDIEAPVWGDKVYGIRSLEGKILESVPKLLEEKLLDVRRQMLHAWVLGFTHPESGKWLQFEVKLPLDFSNILKSWDGAKP